MVINNDLRRNTGSLKCRTEALPDEISLLFCGHQHAGIISRVQRLILNSYCTNDYSLRLHRPDVFHKIPGVGIIILRLQASSDTAFVGFHPHRRRPWRSQNFDSRINGKYFFKHRYETDFVRINAEFLHFFVRFTGWQIIV